MVGNCSVPASVQSQFNSTFAAIQEAKRKPQSRWNNDLLDTEYDTAWEHLLDIPKRKCRSKDCEGLLACRFMIVTCTRITTNPMQKLSCCNVSGEDKNSSKSILIFSSRFFITWPVILNFVEICSKIPSTFLQMNFLIDTRALLHPYTFGLSWERLRTLLISAALSSLNCLFRLLDYSRWI